MRSWKLKVKQLLGRKQYSTVFNKTALGHVKLWRERDM